MSISNEKNGLQSLTNLADNTDKKQLTGRAWVDSESQNIDYYEEYKRVLEISYNLHQQKLGFLQLMDELQLVIFEQENKMDELNINNSQTTSNQNRPKRVRRTNNMIEKKHKCPIKKCQKIYASEGSLQQHLKIKHPEYASENQQQQALNELFM